jgi:hypothetical protein
LLSRAAAPESVVRVSVDDSENQMYKKLREPIMHDMNEILPGGCYHESPSGEPPDLILPDMTPLPRRCLVVALLFLIAVLAIVLFR